MSAYFSWMTFQPVKPEEFFLEVDMMLETQERALDVLKTIKIECENDDKAMSVIDELCNHRIGTAHGNPGIDQFDDDVDDFQIVFDEPAGLGHMAGKPVDNHIYYHLSIFYSTGFGKNRQTPIRRWSVLCLIIEKTGPAWSGSCFCLFYAVVSISLYGLPLIPVHGQ